ncbi:MAG: PCRF domain-containing protein, partial [Gemmatimonadota bacterium]|nr:PCRF domain-containing protein [Gemmatimonadota bacterium]
MIARSRSLGGTFDLELRQERLRTLDQEMVQPGFWDNQDQAKATIDESNRLKGWIDPWSSLDDRVSELTALVELLEEEEDAELDAEFARGLASVEKDLEALEV